MAEHDTAARNGVAEHRGFLILWAAQSVTMLGGQVAFLAFPLVASLTLGATPLQMGLLTALGTLPALLGLIAGPWIDRLPRRALLVGANVGRAALLLAVPAATLLSVLSIELLAIVVLLSGVLALLFDVGYQALLPALVGRDRLIGANSRLELSRAVSELAGPALAGSLLQVLAAPLVLILDAVAYLGSALLLGRLRIPPSADAPTRSQAIWYELAIGLRTIGRSRELRSVIGCAATVNLFNAAFEAAVFIYVPRELGVSPGLFGLVFAIGSAGTLLGAILAERAARAIGPYWLLVGGLLLAGLGDLFTPLAAGSLLAIVVTLSLGALLFGVGISIYRILIASLRQSLTPDALQGRVAATALALTQGATLVGALLGGLLGEVAGAGAALLVGGCGELLSVLWLLPLLRRGVVPESKA